VLFFMDTDLHEHLGQMISYARMNGVVSAVDCGSRRETRRKAA